MSISSTRFFYRDSVLVSLALLALSAFGLRTISNADFWIHLATGRTLLESGWIRTDPFSFTTTQQRIWVNPAWLYDGLLYLLWSAGGAPFVILAGIAMIAGAFAVLRPVAQRLSTPLSAAVAVVLTAWLIAPAFVPAPELPAALCLALAIRLLATVSSRRVAAALIALQVLWTNLHPSFLLGPALAVLFYFDARRASDRQIAVWLPAVLLLATLANPYGLAAHRHALHSLWSPENAALLEWISPMAGEFAPFGARHINTLILLLIASGFVFIKGRLPLAFAMLGVTGAFLMVLSPRFYLFSAVAMFPFLSCCAKAVGEWAQDRGVEVAGRLGRAAVLAAALLTLSAMLSGYYLNRTGSVSTVGLGIAEDIFPEQACAQLLGRPDFPATALNLAQDGGYLAWRLPGRKIFADTRTSVYGSTFYQGFARGLMGDEQIWNNLLERFKPDALILNGSWMGAGHSTRRLVDGGKWALAYFDGLTAVLVRNTQENAKFLLDPTLQQAGLEVLRQNRARYAEETDRVLPARNNARMFGAGQTLFSLWRFREAQDYLALAARGSPTLGLVWQNLGISALQTGEIEPAIHALERAAALRRDPALAWLWLSKAYERENLPRQAQAAKRKAQKLDPKLTESFEKSFAATNQPAALMP